MKAVSNAFNWQNFRMSNMELLEIITNVESFTVANATRALYQRYAQKEGKPRWGEKRPSYLGFMGKINALLPETKFIHIIRDGRDVALSMQNLWWGAGEDWKGQGKYWTDLIRAGRALGTTLGDQYMEVRYETLCRSTEDALRPICDFIKVPYNAVMLRYHETALQEIQKTKAHPRFDRSGKLVMTDERLWSIHELTVMPPQIERAERWRNDMTLNARIAFETTAGDLLRELNYATL
jgi:hypothetical protein